MKKSNSVKKRIRQNFKKYKFNKYKKKKIKKLIKIFILKKKKKKEDLYYIISKIDKCKRCNLFHKNKINRLKNRMYMIFLKK
ncbi:MAG: 30S ribosomal protein S20 [Candidatus Shikimatogenerans sp. Ttur]|uniref:Small ribosomal subunit protein bS20 n=1 Tax=Candidatus Shikimatogenerans sp. Ttur TaxID=3158569 RepID=A0AAU7ZY52_9FLAO